MPRSRARNEDGAVAVEAGVVTLLLATLLFGIIEMSLLMRDAAAASSSVRAGTRVAAAAASAGLCTSGNPDCSPVSSPLVGQAAADAVAQASAGLPSGSIDWLMVYEAGSNGFPTGQSSYICSAKCVTYTWSDASQTFVYSSGSWNTSQVNACVNNSSRNSVGVAMKATHGFVTGLFGDGVDITERNVMYFEPLPNDACLPGAHS